MHSFKYPSRPGALRGRYAAEKSPRGHEGSAANHVTLSSPDQEVESKSSSSSGRKHAHGSSRPITGKTGQRKKSSTGVKSSGYGVVSSSSKSSASSSSAKGKRPKEKESMKSTKSEEKPQWNGDNKSAGLFDREDRRIHKPGEERPKKATADINANAPWNSIIDNMKKESAAKTSWDNSTAVPKQQESVRQNLEAFYDAKAKQDFVRNVMFRTDAEKKISQAKKKVSQAKAGNKRPPSGKKRSQSSGKNTGVTISVRSGKVPEKGCVSISADMISSSGGGPISENEVSSEQQHHKLTAVYNDDEKVLRIEDPQQDLVLVPHAESTSVDATSTRNEVNRPRYIYSSPPRHEGAFRKEELPSVQEIQELNREVDNRMVYRPLCRAATTYLNQGRGVLSSATNAPVNARIRALLEEEERSAAHALAGRMIDEVKNPREPEYLTHQRLAGHHFFADRSTENTIKSTNQNPVEESRHSKTATRKVNAFDNKYYPASERDGRKRSLSRGAVSRSHSPNPIRPGIKSALDANSSHMRPWEGGQFRSADFLKRLERNQSTPSKSSKNSMPQKNFMDHDVTMEDSAETSLQELESRHERRLAAVQAQLGSRGVIGSDEETMSLKKQQYKVMMGMQGTDCVAQDKLRDNKGIIARSVDIFTECILDDLLKQTTQDMSVTKKLNDATKVIRNHLGSSVLAFFNHNEDSVRFLCKSFRVPNRSVISISREIS